MKSSSIAPFITQFDFSRKKKKQSRSDPSWPKSQFISIPLLNSGNRLHWGNRPIRDNSVKPGKVSSRNVICRWVLSEKKGKFNEGRKTSRSNVANLDRKKTELTMRNPKRKCWRPFQKWTQSMEKKTTKKNDEQQTRRRRWITGVTPLLMLVPFVQ